MPRRKLKRRVRKRQDAGVLSWEQMVQDGKNYYLIVGLSLDGDVGFENEEQEKVNYFCHRERLFEGARDNNQVVPKGWWQYEAKEVDPYCPYESYKVFLKYGLHDDPVHLVFIKRMIAMTQKVWSLKGVHGEDGKGIGWEQQYKEWGAWEGFSLEKKIKIRLEDVPPKVRFAEILEKHEASGDA